MPTQHNNSRQEPEYYFQILRILIDCNADGMAYGRMAQVLNDRHLTTPTGLRWSASHISQLLKKLRRYRLYPSFIHENMLALIFEGRLTLKETLPLMQSRVHGIK